MILLSLFRGATLKLSASFLSHKFYRLATRNKRHQDAHHRPDDGGMKNLRNVYWITRWKNPEDSYVRTRLRESSKSHVYKYTFCCKI